jgi:hypothetical protein
VDELIQDRGLRHPTHQLVTTVSEATHGNPLFIQEALHYLVHSGALEERAGYLMASVSPADLRLSTGEPRTGRVCYARSPTGGNSVGCLKRCRSDQGGAESMVWRSLPALAEGLFSRSSLRN